MHSTSTLPTTPPARPRWHHSWAVPLGIALVAVAALVAPRLAHGAPPWADAAAQPLNLNMTPPQSRLIIESRPWRPDVLPPSEAGLPAPRSSLGMAFQTAPSSVQGVRGLLSVRLAGDAALNFRPRKSGLLVQYRSQF